MTNRWRYFIGASILGAGLLLKAGAPLVPIIAGIVLAAFVTWKAEQRKNRLHL